MMPSYYWATTRKRWMNMGSWYPYNYINTKVILTINQYSSFFHFTSNPNVLWHIRTCMWSTHRPGPIYYLLTHTNSSKLSHSILPVSKPKVLSIILGHKEVKSYFNTICQGINFFPKDFLNKFYVLNSFFIELIFKSFDLASQLNVCSSENCIVITSIFALWISNRSNLFNCLAKLP